VLNATGWSFVDEGGPGKRKWGYISSKPDSLLTIKVRNRLLLLSCKLPTSQAWQLVNTHHLKP
jgi:hypothetical protein